jgi:hypothetical protein
MKTCLRSLGAMVLLVAAGTVQAIPLSDLFAGQSITAGDKLFDQWRLISAEYSSDTLIVNADNINVTALNDGGLDPGPGLAFSVSNNAFNVTGGDARIDYTIGFRVTVTDPGLLIKDNRVQLTSGFVTNAAENGFSIREIVGTDPSLLDVLASKYVEFSWTDGALVSNVIDSASFAPQSQIYLSKEIEVWATAIGANVTASLGGFEQRFSQTTVPEPATLALLGVALAGLGFSRRRTLH